MLSRVRLSSRFLIAAMMCFGLSASGSDRSEADLDFADPPLGSSWQAISQGLAYGSNCYVQSGSFDCEFIDQKGLRYLVSGTDIIRKEVDEEGDAESPSVPFGLQFGDSAARVREQVESEYAVKLEYEQLPVGRRYAATLSTGLSLVNEIGVMFGLYFMFDKEDRLTAVGVTVGEPG